MKTNFKFAVPEMKSDDRTVFPGAELTFNFEYEAQEFLALLPHVIEFQKVIGPQIAELRTQILAFLSAAGAAVTPEVLAMAKKLLDYQIDNARRSDDASFVHKQEVHNFEMRRDSESHDLDLQHRRELHDLERRKASKAEAAPIPEDARNGSRFFNRS